MVVAPSKTLVFTQNEIDEAHVAEPTTSVQRLLIGVVHQIRHNEILVPDAACSLERERDVLQISIRQDGATFVVFKHTLTFSLPLEAIGLHHESLAFTKKLISKLVAKQDCIDAK